MMSFLKTFVLKAVNSYRDYRCCRLYAAQFRKYLVFQGIEDKKAVGEEAYLEKWRALAGNVEPYSYRFYRHYMGNNPNIIPEDIGHSVIERILNPPRYRAFYSDKNLLPVIVGKECVPLTLVCRMNGGNLLNGEFRLAEMNLFSYLDNEESVILKPTVGTSSGRGILKFVKEGENFVSTDGERKLTRDFLLTYGNDFCLQKTVKQHAFLNQFCSTSVNTLRLCVYRSVCDEIVRVTAATIRIGKNGSFVDNTHAGGKFVGINVKTGELGKYAVDHCGNKSTVWNNVNYSIHTFFVPHWNDIVSFAEYVGSRVHHHRLLALDIALNEQGMPILIEFNIRTFSYWFYQLTNQEVFGDYTDEVINYCQMMKSRGGRI